MSHMIQHVNKHVCQKHHACRCVGSLTQPRNSLLGKVALHADSIIDNTKQCKCM